MNVFYLDLVNHFLSPLGYFFLGQSNIAVACNL